MPRKNQRIEVITPPIRIKYKKFCKKIHKQYHNKYIFYDDENNKPQIDLPYLMTLLVERLKPKINKLYVHNKKYDEIDFINGILDIVSNCRYWNRYHGKVAGKYLNKRHNQYVKWNVYECLYRIILLAYFSDNKYNKLHYQAIDSTFIKNLYGKEVYGRFYSNKFKNGIKVSVVCDSKGVPISIATASANLYDSTIAEKQLSSNSYLIETESEKVKNNNKYKQILLGDAAYFNKNIYSILRKKRITAITDVNIRRTKNGQKIYILKQQKNKYLKKQKKRLVVENCFSWLLKYPKLDVVVEKTIKSYNGLLMLAFSMIVKNKLN